MYKRAKFDVLCKRIREPRRFIQVLAGPRQSGKTTMVHQAMKKLSGASRYGSADEPALKNQVWIEQQWESARLLLTRNKRRKSAVLVLDEIQKIPGWSETLKRLWDEDTRNNLPLMVVILGSAPLLLQSGLSESLAGRFEIIPMTHWSYREMKEAFGWSLEQYIYYGGYPGSAPLIGEPRRWTRYILDSLVETTISRDVLLMQRVDKPVLLRRLFEIGCQYSGQILSFTKMLGQLHDAGNTTTLAHYLELLQGAGLLEGLKKYASQNVRQRASSPKFQVHNNALITSQSNLTFEESRERPEVWGRLVESAVGVHLINESRGTSVRVFYWNGRNSEVDFVLAKGNNLVAIEVKSSMKKTALPGIAAFSKEFKVSKKLLVGGQGIALNEFLLMPVEDCF